MTTLVASQRTEYSSRSRRCLTMFMINANTSTETINAKIFCWMGIRISIGIVTSKGGKVKVDVKTKIEIKIKIEVKIEINTMILFYILP